MKLLNNNELIIFNQLLHGAGRTMNISTAESPVRCDDIVCAFQTIKIVPAISVQQGSCKGLLPIIKVSGEKDLRIKDFL
jgi:hypothetical protein